ncbi:F-box-like domain superfamily [Arabidopsis suecica]|uniref:F-box-like domain superfamily n=1 Tax=Arabidopsis suecica TaxID=45249 RepID=A0A8T2AHW5_ARASU|nr:F-box-like domain superfamily [Arabidopsis suecica]
MLLKRHRSCEEEELLPHDVIELILETLPVEALFVSRFVSKKWKSTIDFRRFKERRLQRRRQSRGVHVLFLCVNGENTLKRDDNRVFSFGSSVARTGRIPYSGPLFCYGSCDGIICLYGIHTPSIVVNPATGWHQNFPLCSYQELYIPRFDRKHVNFPSPKLGLGKDKFTGTYKPVWFYNSSVFGLDNATTCELFDFTTNAWRFVVPASPYQINAYHKPVYLDGSLYWFTDCEEPKVLSLDFHTETFQVICKAPFAHPCDPRQLTMCILDNRLCVSEKKWPTQVIWSFHSSGKTWNQMCCIDLTQTFSWFGVPEFALSPIAIMDKGKLLLQGRDTSHALVIHDLHTKSYDFLFKPTRPVGSVQYVES